MMMMTDVWLLMLALYHQLTELRQQSCEFSAVMPVSTGL